MIQNQWSMFSFENTGITSLTTLQISTAEARYMSCYWTKYDQLASHGPRYKQQSDSEPNIERQWQDLTWIFLPNGELGIKSNFKTIHIKGWLWCDKWQSIKQLTEPVYAGTWMSQQNMPFLPDMSGMFKKCQAHFLKFYVKVQSFCWRTKCVQMVHRSMK